MFGEPPFDYVFGDRCLPPASTHVGIATPRRHGTLYLILAMCYIGSLYLSNGTTSRNHGTMYLITAILCIGEAAATSSNYADSQEEKESEQNSGPQRNDYTTHSLRTEILIAMTATMLLIVMIDRTVCRLTRPTDKPDAQNDGAEKGGRTT